MGGCTISAIRDTREEALEDVKAKIIEAASKGLWPDSELVILQNEREEAELYTVELFFRFPPLPPPRYEIKLQKVDVGRAFHVGVAAKFTRAMKPGEWIASVHVHT